MKELTAAEKERMYRARALRYKRPLAKQLNIDAIQDDLFEMQEACADVRYMYSDDLTFDELIDALDGDEEEVSAFKIAFYNLDADIERLLEDLKKVFWEYFDNEDEYWNKESIFDLIFAVMQNTHGEMMGYDVYEGDYFALDDDSTRYAMDVAAKKLERLTKKELIEKMQTCGAVLLCYLGIRERYRDLKASIDILRAQNRGLTKALKAVSEAYEKANDVSNGFRRPAYQYIPEVEKYEKLLSILPEDVWIR